MEKRSRTTVVARDDGFPNAPTVEFCAWQHILAQNVEALSDQVDLAVSLLVASAWDTSYATSSEDPPCLLYSDFKLLFAVDPDASHVLQILGDRTRCSQRQSVAGVEDRVHFNWVSEVPRPKEYGRDVLAGPGIPRMHLLAQVDLVYGGYFSDPGEIDPDHRVKVLGNHKRGFWVDFEILGKVSGKPVRRLRKVD